MRRTAVKEVPRIIVGRLRPTPSPMVCNSGSRGDNKGWCATFSCRKNGGVTIEQHTLLTNYSESCAAARSADAGRSALAPLLRPQSENGPGSRMATAPMPQPEGASRSRSYELRVLVLLGLAFGFAYFDRMALTFLAPFVQGDLSLTNEEIGWANSGLSLT